MEMLGDLSVAVAGGETGCPMKNPLENLKNRKKNDFYFYRGRSFFIHVG
jgi:hypothetical protein